MISRLQVRPEICLWARLRQQHGDAAHQDLLQPEPHFARPQMPPKVIRRSLSSAGGAGSALPLQLSHSGLTASSHPSLAAELLSAPSSCLLGASHVTVVLCSMLHWLSPFDFDCRRTGPLRNPFRIRREIVHASAPPRHARIQNLGYTSLAGACTK